MALIISSTYEILQEIGSGGGGIVYLARHLRLAKLVVLKADRHGLSSQIEKLRREADALKSLSHTYIPQVYDFIVEDEVVYTVLSYIEGESFDKPLKRGERFAQPLVIKWLRQLLSAVYYLHSSPPHGILHSDIKPANIMLTPSGDICLIDFNIALALGAEGAVAVGASRGYASPEHYGAEALAEATGRAPSGIDPDKTEPVTGLASTAYLGSSTQTPKTVLLDVRSDIYSLGATMYHILSGKRPALKIRDIEPLPRTEYSPGFIDIIEKAMNPDPDLRYQTAAEMLEAVNSLPETDPRYKKYVRNRSLACGVLGTMLLCSSFAIFTGLRRMEQTQNALVQTSYSAAALAEGDVEGALRYAMAAIPDKTGVFTPPVTSQAQDALTEALQVYDLSDGYKSAGAVQLPSAPFKLRISPTGEHLAAVYENETALIELSTQEVIARLPSANSALADVEFVGDLLIYAGSEGVSAFSVREGRNLWSGDAATEIAVSGDGQTIAAVNRDAGEAVIYDMAGTAKMTLSFEGKSQKVLMNDTFGNPGDNLLALSPDGSLLAASFSDGSLDLFDMRSGEIICVQSSSDFIHFEGGFYENYFVFSATGSGQSRFAVIDTDEMVQTGESQASTPFGVLADASGVYLSLENVLVKIDPQTGEQQEMACMEANIRDFDYGGNCIIVATQENDVALFDEYTNNLGQFSIDSTPDFVQAAGSYAVAGGRDTVALRIMEKRSYSEADVFLYDPEYYHTEARINASTGNILLFSYQGFRLYGKDGTVLCETALSDAARVYDQQYSPASGNLAVIYPDALCLYSGEDGQLLLEKTGLKSVSYAPYGISILEQDGKASLIDMDTAQTVQESTVEGDFAAFCGIVVDQSFLGGRNLIGAAMKHDSYLFAVSDYVTAEVYDADGKLLFAIPVDGKSEAYFVGEMLVVSPQHGTPAVYSVPRRKKLADLQPDSYLTYATLMDEYIISEYITAGGDRFGLLLNDKCEVIARLPKLTDAHGREVYFDYNTGSIRKSYIYSLSQLIELAKGGKQEK